MVIYFSALSFVSFKLLCNSIITKMKPSVNTDSVEAMFFGACSFGYEHKKASDRMPFLMAFAYIIDAMYIS